ncbi:MAG: cobalt-zinc-cadmium efflux system membrane fusion protein, partial [Bradymonadia bacterium]
GVVAWIASEVDRRTRAVSVRVEVPNPDGALRAGQFARATVQVAPATLAASVPKEAVQRFGASSVVFVRVGAGVFEPRVVQPGRADRHRVQVVGALAAGEPVVTTGAFLLRTELDRDSIGAGCCEVEGPGAR